MNKKLEIEVNDFILKIEYDDTHENPLASASNILLSIEDKIGKAKDEEKIGFIELAMIIRNYIFSVKYYKGCCPCKYLTNDVMGTVSEMVGICAPDWPVCSLKGKPLDMEKFKTNIRPEWCPLGENEIAVADPMENMKQQCGGGCSCGGDNCVH